MNEVAQLIVPGAVGLALGLLFFGGLWWTIQRGVAAKRGALWFAGSLLVRTGVALGGFYWVSGGQWQRLLACLLGFVIARAGVTWLCRPRQSTPSDAPEARHAS